MGALTSVFATPSQHHTDDHDGSTSWKSDARFAMESSWFCVICGAPLDLAGDVYGLNTEDERYKWMLSYRLLGDIENVMYHCTSVLDSLELGRVNLINISKDPYTFLSEPTYFDYTGSMYFRLYDRRSAGGEVWFTALESMPGCGTLVPVHDACLAVGQRVVSRFRAKREVDLLPGMSDLGVLNRFLQDRFQRVRSGVRVGGCEENDLLELDGVDPIWGPRSVVALTLIEWWRGEFDRFYEDPLTIPNLTSFIADLLATPSQHPNTDISTFQPSRPPQSLECLPTELLSAITEHLPVASVISLHRTSRALALKVPLDDRFCRKGLLSGALNPQIWDLDAEALQRMQTDRAGSDEQKPWHWRSVAKLLTAKGFASSGRDSQLADLPVGLWNRARIWSIIEDALHQDFPPRTDPRMVIRARGNSVGA